MVIQIIESRYTVEYDVLVAFLSSIFAPSLYDIVVRMCLPEYSLQRVLLINHQQIPDEGEKWKVNVPRELTRVCHPSDRTLATVQLTCIG